MQKIPYLAIAAFMAVVAGLYFGFDSRDFVIFFSVASVLWLANVCDSQRADIRRLRARLTKLEEQIPNGQDISLPVVR